MSGTQVSGFADPNILYKSLSGLGTAEVQRNQLLNQAEQQTITDHDIAAVGQAAAPLLNLSEDDAAKAYPGWLQDQQSRGIAKHAPQSYPGHAAVQALVQRALPILDQYKAGFITTPADQEALQRAFPGLHTGAGTGTGSAGTGGGTATIGGADTAPINAAGDSRTRKAAEGGPPAAGTPGARSLSRSTTSGSAKGSARHRPPASWLVAPAVRAISRPRCSATRARSYGLYQHHGPRLDAMRQFFGLSGSQNPTADQQNQYAHWEITQGPLKNVGEMLKTAKTPPRRRRSGRSISACRPTSRRSAGGQPGRSGSSASTEASQGRQEARRRHPDRRRVCRWGATFHRLQGALQGPTVGAASVLWCGGQPAPARATIPAGRPTGPPVITDQPAGGDVVAGPPV